MMLLFKTIDNLIISTRYLGWGIALVGNAISIVLFFANLSLGLASAVTFVAAFLMCVGVTLLLLPRTLAKGPLAEAKKRNIVGAVVLLLAAAVMGVVYFSVGDFPALNLLFI